MLVIKMLKKASSKNNIELAMYLDKTRNTIASWEADENSIPHTEKMKLSNRFEFDYEYWNVGLDRTTIFYQKMYSDIKNGYLRDSRRQSYNNNSRIEEILNFCDGTNGIVDHYKSFNKSNEYNHYIYIKSLLEGIDPIDNTKIDNNHFINEYRIHLKGFDRLFYKFEESIDFFAGEKEIYDKNIDSQLYLNKLKTWRKLQAAKENVKPFQVLSDEVLENIVKAYKDNNRELSGIKNFPVTGVKWQKYYETIINILDEG